MHRLTLEPQLKTASSRSAAASSPKSGIHFLVAPEDGYQNSHPRGSSRQANNQHSLTASGRTQALSSQRPAWSSQGWGTAAEQGHVPPLAKTHPTGLTSPVTMATSTSSSIRASAGTAAFPGSGFAACLRPPQPLLSPARGLAERMVRVLEHLLLSVTGLPSSSGALGTSTTLPGEQGAACGLPRHAKAGIG